MKMKFNQSSLVQISQKEHIVEAIKLFGEDVSKNVSAPATKSLFVEDPDAESLDQDKADICHSRQG